MQRHRSYEILFVLALVSTSATAAAEDKPKDARTPAASSGAGRSSPADGYNYTFTDDALLAGATGVLGFPLRIPVPAIRVTLIRPRTSFIVELLKSVENL